MRVTIAVALLALAGCDQLFTTKVVAAKGEIPHYQLAIDKDGNAWRLNTVTGEMKKCWQGTPGAQA